MSEIQKKPEDYLAEGYRKNVGIVVYKDGLVWLGERSDVAGAWQFPQGGVDDGEDLLAAARRELQEETGLAGDDIELMALHGNWTVYHLPKEIRTQERKGQVQKWFLFHYKGDEAEIDLTKATDQEFISAEWVTPEEAVKRVVDFRKEVYEEVLDVFKSHIGV